MVRRAALRVLEVDLAEVIVVVGHHAPRVQAAIADLPLRVVLNPRYREGQSTSVRAGLDAVSAVVDGVLFMPCDQPWLSAETLSRLLVRFRSGDEPIVVAAAGERSGAPAIFDRSQFADLAALVGDVGGRQLVRRFPDRVGRCDIGDPRALDDLDHRPP